MSEDECDLDVLVSLLDDDSNSGDVKQRDPPDNKSVGKGNGNSPQSSTLTKGPQPANEDEDCDIDSLAAFLEEDGDFEEGDTGNKLSKNKGISLSEERGGPSESKPACAVISELLQSQSSSDEKCELSLSRTALDEMSEQEEEEDDETDDDTNDDTDIQAELLNIQKKMLELQSQLKKKKKKLTIDSTDENPFFASSDPGDEGKGTSGLFGDSDSDWEELDGDVKPGLSESGQVIHDLMKTADSQRVSSASLEDVKALRQKALKSKSWKTGPFPGQEMVNPPRKNGNENYQSITDPFSGIRIINPKISSMEMKYKMADRKLIKLSKIHLKLKSAELQGDWVTVGVIVHKSEPRTSSSGKSFCIWRLSDLDDCDQTISFFLFGEVFKQHWKNEVKSVVGILNPNKLDKADKGQQDMAFTVNHPNQIMMMGYSQDLGKCAGVSKAGKACTNFINKEQRQFCVYHVQSAYKKTCAKRTELQGSSAVTPKNHVFGRRNNKDSLFFYGGETFTNTKRKASQKDQVTVSKLQAKQLQSQGKFTTMSLHDLDPADKEKLRQLEQKKNDLVDLLATPTVGSLNFVKHLVKKENPKETDCSGDKKVEIQSISPAELLKQHKQDMVRRRKSRQSGLPSLESPQNPKDVTPKLARGGSMDGFISLDMSKKAKPVSSTEIAKLMAISKVKRSGGIQKEDPNALKRKRDSPERNTVDEKEKLEEPPVKRSKLLGNIDENSEEFKNLMKSRSKHTGTLAQVEMEQEERYFMELEKKEKYEDKMQSTMSVRCTVFTCKNCNYTAMKLADKCKTERHTIVKSETSKRFFKCKHCGKRKISIHKYPTEPCECGEYSFQRTAMMEEKKGPKLPGEKLSLRGDEVSYLGAMKQTVYLNI
uniref:Protein MCM10 homolog n=1 Tax=Magallana gigas TaxID=29159 RepID=K1QYT0_MAGGI